MEPIGDKIKRIRKSKGISQTMVADTCNIKQSSYANIESGKTQNITIEIGKGIAKALDVSFNELFEIENIGIDFQNKHDENDKLLLSLKEKDKQIEQKDLLIDMLKKENQKLTEMTAWDGISEIFNMLLDCEISLKYGEPNKKEQKILNKNIQIFSDKLKKEIDKSLALRHIDYKTVLGIFLESGLQDITEDESESKAKYIENCTSYINQFFEVAEKEVELFIEKNIITKWDKEKISNRAKELKGLYGNESIDLFK